MVERLPSSRLPSTRSGPREYYNNYQQKKRKNGERERDEGERKSERGRQLYHHALGVDAVQLTNPPEHHRAIVLSSTVSKSTSRYERNTSGREDTGTGHTLNKNVPLLLSVDGSSISENDSVR
jgi:hypothetical protein